MFARSTTIMGIPGKVDAGIAYVRDEVMPAISEMDGCVGLSMLINRDSGRCITTTSWLTEEALHASDQSLSPHRGRAGEILGGPPTVEVWEVALMHREHQASEANWCRVTWLQTAPAEVDSSLEYYKENVLTRLEDIDGFCSASMLIDQVTGRGCGTVRFDTRAALDATRELASTMRSDRLKMGGIEFIEVDDLELAIAHLRVPELV